MSTYALSDIHGFKSIYDQVKDMLKPEDKVIFLGDATDRGPHGWQCMTTILDDPQFEYILGNHDLFLIRSYFGPSIYRNAKMWEMNGGDYTQNSMMGVTPEERDEYLSRLLKCPYYKVYDNEQGMKIYLSHSGRYKIGAICGEKETEDFTWDRAHFGADAPEEVDLIVHGHTPVKYLISLLNDITAFYTDEEIKADGDQEFVPGKPFYYAHHSKCDIDSGTVRTGAACLLNLDTLEGTPIYVEGKEKTFLWK